METGSLVGIILVLVGIFVGSLTKGVNPVVLLTNVPAILIVIVGSLGATMLSFRMVDTTGILKVIITAFKGGEKIDRVDTLKKILEFSRRARTEGILSLESEVDKIENAFLRKGLRMAIDGVDPDDVAGALETDTQQMKQRHKIGASWCTSMGIFAPTFGIIGAVMGLIATLGKLGGGDVEAMGVGISAAFVATFWGVFLANGLFLPWANKLKRLSEDEAGFRQMITEGVLAIQNGVNPRVVEEGLASFLTPSEQKQFLGGGGK